MNTFREHLLQKDLFETTAQHIVEAYEAAGALPNNGGSTKNWFDSFTLEPTTLSAGGKAPDGFIYIRSTRWVGDSTDTDYTLVPMDLLDEVYVVRIHERATELANKIVADREAAKERAAQAAKAKREADEIAKLQELAAKHPNVLLKSAQ